MKELTNLMLTLFLPPSFSHSVVLFVCLCIVNKEEVRKKDFEEKRSFYSPFQNVNLEKISDYLKEIGMFNEV